MTWTALCNFSKIIAKFKIEFSGGNKKIIKVYQKLRNLYRKFFLCNRSFSIYHIKNETKNGYLIYLIYLKY